MRARPDPDRRVPDLETWDLPHRLSGDDCRAATRDGDRTPPRFEEEDDR